MLSFQMALRDIDAMDFATLYADIEANDAQELEIKDDVAL